MRLPSVSSLADRIADPLLKLAAAVGSARSPLMHLSGLLLLEPEVRELQGPRVLSDVHHRLARNSIGDVGVNLQFHAHLGAGELGQVLDDVFYYLGHLRVHREWESRQVSA